MAISDPQEVPGEKHEAPHAADLQSSLRRRLAAAVVSASSSVADSSSKAYVREAETSTACSGDESCTETSAEGVTRDQIADAARDREDKKESSLAAHSGNYAERAGDQEDEERESGGEVHMRYMYPTSAPAHRRVKESPLSSDAIFRQSHAGLFNLCIVVLVAVNSRLIIENIMKYGLLIRSGFWFSSRSLSDWPLLMCCFTFPLFPLGSFFVEKLAWNKCISKPAILLSVILGNPLVAKEVFLLVISLHVLITTASILWPVFVILRCDSSVLSGLALMLFGCIVWLKLVSYVHTNYDIRALSNLAEKGDASSSSLIPEIVQGTSLQSLIYFMLAPTLCYQPTYPRSTCVRKGWVTRQALKLVIFTGVMGFIVEQYINPIVKNSQHPLKGNFLYAVERVLKLSVPTLYVWLCMFYCFFHLWLNILAELLRFGDREFYKDWWNAKTVEEYWRMWNMPVHKWMIRHIYLPCLRNGLPKGAAIVIAFLISAIFHELVIGVPCHLFKFWAFIGIMFQVPLVILTNYLQRKFKNNMVGNMIFWSFFSIFGQPMCVLLYYHDVMNRKVRASNG